MKILIMESGSLEPRDIRPASIPMSGIARVDSLRKTHAVAGGAIKASFQLYKHFSEREGKSVDIFANLSTVSPGLHRIRDSKEIVGREYDFILMNSLRDVLTVSGYVRRHKGVKTIYTDRGNAVVNYIKTRPHKRLSPWMLASGYLLRDMRRWLSTYVAITEEQESFARKFFGKRTEIKYIPIAPDTEYTRLSMHRTYGGAIYVGRLDERQKKINFLLRGIAVAAAKYPSLRKKKLLRIYGSGPDEQAYKGLVAELGLSKNVRFAGFRSGRALVEAFNNAGFLVLTSEWESPGRVLLESMACGTTVLINERINAKIGPGRLVHDGENGVVYKYDDLRDFAEKFYELCTKSSLRNRLSANAFKASMRFSLVHVLGEYDKLVR